MAETLRVENRIVDLNTYPGRELPKVEDHDGSHETPLLDDIRKPEQQVTIAAASDPEVEIPEAMVMGATQQLHHIDLHFREIAEKTLALGKYVDTVQSKIKRMGYILTGFGLLTVVASKFLA
jgi:hypothetical protein